MPSDVSTWLTVAQLVASVAGVLITVWIAFLVQRSATKLTQLEFTRAVRESWIHVDELTLGDANLLRLANTFLPQRQGADEAFGQKRIFLLSYLIPLSTTYLAATQGLFGDKGREVIETVKLHIGLVVADDDGFWVTQNHGHDPDFMAMCREVRAHEVATAAASRAEQAH